jgi:hypothetical protein
LTHGVFFKIYINEMGGQKFKMAGWRIYWKLSLKVDVKNRL